MSKLITYRSYPNDNTKEVLAFIGPVPPCPICNDHGEYETEHGPKGCGYCCSRLIPYYNEEGQRCYIDYEETLEEVSPGKFRKL